MNPRPEQGGPPASPLFKSRLNTHVFLLLMICQISGAWTQDTLPIPFQAGEYWGYKDERGGAVIAARYIMAMPFSRHGLAAVVDDSGWVYINRQGKKLIRPYVFDNGPDYFCEGLARYVSGGRIGFFDESGRIVIPAKFQFAAPFSGGFSAFCERCVPVREGEHTRQQGGKWGYLDKKGAIVIDARFERASAFKNGVAEVSINGQNCKIDTSGALLP
jgi:hypothetical protein